MIKTVSLALALVVALALPLHGQTNDYDENYCLSDKTPSLHKAVHNADDDSVRLLLNAGACVNDQDQWGNTPLMEALYSWRTDWCTLPEYWNDTVTVPTATPTAIITSDDNFVPSSTLLTSTLFTTTLLSEYLTSTTLNELELLLSITALNNYKCPEDDLYPCYNSDIIKTLIAAGSDLNLRNSDGFTALHCAIVNGHSQFAVFLMENQDCLTAQQIFLIKVYSALKHRNTEAFKLLVAHKNFQLLDKTDLRALLFIPGCYNHHKPLLRCNQQYNMDVIEAFIETGVPLDIQGDYQGRTIAHYAASKGGIRIIKALTAAGINLNEKNIYGDTPLSIAVKYGWFRDTKSHDLRDLFVQELIAEGASIDTEQSTEILCKAVEKGLTGTVQLLIKSGVPFNLPGKDGNAPLHTAWWYHQLEMVKILTTAGASVSPQFLGRVLLHAVDRNHPERVPALLDAGATLDEKDSSGKTALHRAIDIDDRNAIELPMQHGAKLNTQDNAECIPTHYRLRWK